jgi:hypothetical protein
MRDYRISQQLGAETMRFFLILKRRTVESTVRCLLIDFSKINKTKGPNEARKRGLIDFGQNKSRVDVFYKS